MCHYEVMKQASPQMIEGPEAWARFQKPMKEAILVPCEHINKAHRRGQ